MQKCLDNLEKCPLDYEGGPETTKYLERLDYEMNIIYKMGFCNYFLIVEDYVTWAENNGIITGPGRGSAAGSLISYLLGITKIDPIKYNLLFERFLNRGRAKYPLVSFDEVPLDEWIKKNNNKVSPF